MVLLTTGSNDDDIVSALFYSGGEKTKVGDYSDDVKDTQILQPDRRESATVLLGLVVPWRGCC